MGKSASDPMDALLREVARAPDVKSIGPGSMLGELKVLRRIGAGGMGEVFAAEDPKLGRVVAVKLLPLDWQDDPARRARFEREAQILAALNHPSIVTVHAVGEWEGRPFLVMELVDGQPLSELIPKNGFPPEKTIGIALELTDALAAAHKAGVIHRDLKPQNLMVTADGRLKVLDFGLAKLDGPTTELGPTQTATADGRVLGTVAYMSPEQARGQSADARSDLFAAGIVLFEIATGRRPFDGDSNIAVLSSILKDEPPDVSQLNRALPAAFARVIRRCLEKAPERRYQSAVELRNDLAKLPRDASRRQRVVWTVGALFAVTAFAAFAAGRASVQASAAASAASMGAAPSIAPPTSNALRIERFVQLTSDPGPEVEADLSPDGTWFVYAAKRNGRWDVYRQRVGGENPQNLTAGEPGDCRAPSISPDGEHIAYFADHVDGGLFVMGATGETPHRVSEVGAEPAWTRDGKSLVASTQAVSDPRKLNPGSRIFIVDVESGRRRELAGTDDGYQPAAAPNGDQIAYFGTTHGQREIFLLDLAANAPPRRLTSDTAIDWRPRFLPDGSGLVYASTRAGGMNLFLLPFEPAQASPQSLTLGAARWMCSPSFSRDGKRMLFVAGEQVTIVNRQRFDPVREELVGTPQSVGPGELGNVKHGRVVYWDTQRGEDIVLVDATGRHRLTDMPEMRNRHPVFTPDGGQVIFASNRSGRYDLWRIGIDGRGLEQITHDLEINEPRVSPDGKRIAAYSQTSGPLMLDLAHPDAPEWIVPPAGRDKLVIFTDWTPDGTRVLARVLAGHKTELWIYDVNARRFDLVSESADRAAALPDSRRIVYTAEHSIVLFDLTSHHRKTLLTLRDEQLAKVTLSEDGREIAYGVSSWPSDVWMAALTK